MSTPTETIRRNCTDAGLPIVADVLDILYARGTVSTETLVRATVSDTDVFQLYEVFLGPAVDALEEALLREQQQRE